MTTYLQVTRAAIWLTSVGAVIVLLKLQMEFASMSQVLEKIIAAERVEVLYPIGIDESTSGAATARIAPLVGTAENKHPPLQFVIHVGPGKTATTTIQKDLGLHLSTALAADHYAYMGKNFFGQHNPPNEIHQFQALFIDCSNRLENMLGNHSNEELDRLDPGELLEKTLDIPDRVERRKFKCWREFNGYLNLFRRRGESIILSMEEMSFDEFVRNTLSSKVFAKFFLDYALKDWDVVAVSTYRRYYEWLLSSKKERDSEYCLRNKRAWTDAPECQDPWPQVSRFRKQKMAAGKYLFTNQALEPFHAHKIPTHILNFHETRGTISSRLACDVLSHAPRTCALAKDMYQNKSKVTRANVRSELSAYFDQLVMAAAHAGLLSKENDTRMGAFNDLVQLQLSDEDFRRDLPMKCPRKKELQSLLDESLVLEQEIVPDFFSSPDGKEKAIHHFWQMANEQKLFCAIDTATILDGLTSWKQVLDDFRVKKATKTQ